MAEKFLKKLIKINEINELQDQYPSGTLVLSCCQDVIDRCEYLRIPVAGYVDNGLVETNLDDAPKEALHCAHLLMDVDQVEDEDMENVYRRCAGIPWDIADTDRCHIRELALSDLDALFSLYAKPGVTTYMEPLFEYEEERKYQQNYLYYIYNLYGFGQWLVFDKITEELIGRAGIECRESCDRENQAELGFCITPERWHQGLGYEVCSKVVKLAQDRYGLTSLIARCDPENVASRSLLSKLGFVHVGFENDGDCRYFLNLGDSGE